MGVVIDYRWQGSTWMLGSILNRLILILLYTLLRSIWLEFNCESLISFLFCYILFLDFISDFLLYAGDVIALVYNFVKTIDVIRFFLKTAFKLLDVAFFVIFTEDLVGGSLKYLDRRYLCLWGF